jgi:hypothetical protein
MGEVMGNEPGPNVKAITAVVPAIPTPVENAHPVASANNAFVLFSA